MIGKLFTNYRNIVNEHKNEEIVFYSEGRYHSEHLFPIAMELLKRKKVLYVTSDKFDPVLFHTHHNLSSFFIDTDVFRALFFKNVSCNLFITSLPDLNKFIFKKSKHSPYYIYIHHSIVSIHMAYREGAFDEFNEIFCVGPHHMKELSQLENQFNLPKKVLTEHGNAKIDSLNSSITSNLIKNSVLIAPSWGVLGLFESHINKILDLCKKNEDFLFILRPHSETIRKCEYIDKILKDTRIPNVIYDTGESKEWFLRSEVMISDWSGAAYEFIFGLQKPVIFIDLPKKINNIKYNSLNIEPFEVSQRDKFGIVVNLEELNRLPSLIGKAKAQISSVQKKSYEYVYNIGNSALTAANIIFKRINFEPEDVRKKLKIICEHYNVPSHTNRKSSQNIVESVVLQIRNDNFDKNFIICLIKKIDVSKDLYDSYDFSWRKVVDARKLIKDELLIISFYLLSLFEKLIHSNKSLALKVSNSLLNICEIDKNIKEEYLDYFRQVILEGIQ